MKLKDAKFSDRMLLRCCTLNEVKTYMDFWEETVCDTEQSVFNKSVNREYFTDKFIKKLLKENGCLYFHAKQIPASFFSYMDLGLGSMKYEVPENIDGWFGEIADFTDFDWSDYGVTEFEREKPRTRKTKREYYLDIAKAVSTRSTCLRRNYGAVIVKDDVILATGYNGSARGRANCCDTGICNRVGHKHNDGNYACCPAIHAEANAIIIASRQDMVGATLYLYGTENGEPIKNTEPCPDCKKLISNSGIAKVITTDKEFNVEKEF